MQGANNLPDDSVYETPSNCSYSPAALEKQGGRGTTTVNREVAPPSFVRALYKKFGEEDNGHMDASTAQKPVEGHRSGLHTRPAPSSHLTRGVTDSQTLYIKYTFVDRPPTKSDSK